MEEIRDACSTQAGVPTGCGRRRRRSAVRGACASADSSMSSPRKRVDCPGSRWPMPFEINEALIPSIRREFVDCGERVRSVPGDGIDELGIAMAWDVGLVSEESAMVYRCRCVHRGCVESRAVGNRTRACAPSAAAAEGKERAGDSESSDQSGRARTGLTACGFEGRMHGFPRRREQSLRA